MEEDYVRTEMSGSVQTTGIPNYKQNFRWLAKSARVSLSSYASLNSSHLCLPPINHPLCFDGPVDLRAAQDCISEQIRLDFSSRIIL